MTYHTTLLQREQSPFHHIQHTNTHEPSFLFKKNFIIISIIIFFFYFTVLYWFCHTSTCIRHGCTHVPLPEPSFLITQATFSPTCPPSLGVSQETFCLSADFFSPFWPLGNELGAKLLHCLTGNFSSLMWVPELWLSYQVCFPCWPLP